MKFDRSVLGGLWSVLNPLAQVAIFALILSNVLEAKIGDIKNQYSFAIYLCAGFTCWSLFNAIVERSLSVFITNGELIKKAAFPKIVLLANVVCGALVDNLFLLLAVLVLYLLSGFEIPVVYLGLLPVLLTLTVMLATGIGLILGVLNTFIRDVGQITQILLQVLFWFTPIVYPLNIVPEKLQHLMMFNPVYPLVNAYQKILVFQILPDFEALFATFVLSAGVLALGGGLYSKAADDMADIL